MWLFCFVLTQVSQGDACAQYNLGCLYIEGDILKQDYAQARYWWLKAGAVAVGAGSSLTAGAKTGDYKQITETGKKFVANIKAARAELGL